ncbi:hypothetical protein C5C24_05865 [Rathayibacter sp. AY2B3]|uniref:hypothetical protein n=1 Tax=unclassified Rathayibacter TaxID=2609250 RepID=UPI000CE8C509|nr:MULTISPECIES: hypothetical protein [unclassified Rathayibacter]PPG52003.1 hypothetical protein C5C24_05865 [Rathayibacter sp. AY2B3]PPI24252.1 hypothetical protein C5D08_03385 [Rathayibacter sp. AY1B6]PPI36718.1 hypothetical protein C5D34_05630 [Rathayibacter sp. AY1B1]
MPIITRRFPLTARGSFSLVAGAVFCIAAASPDSARLPEDCSMLVETGQTVCVDRGEDLDAAVLARTGRVVVETSLDDPSTSKAATSPLSLADSQYVLGYVYDDIDFGGDSFRFTTWDSALCSPGKRYGTSSLRSIGWNDRLSSFSGRNGCLGTIFMDDDYSGGSFGPVGSAAWVGDSFNDKASSIQWAR